MSRAKAARHTPTQSLPFPDLPSPKEADEVFFWLSAWMRAVAAYEALATFNHSAAVSNARIKSAALSLALANSICHAKHEIRVSAEYLRDVGGLLFAFSGTTKLQQVPA